MIRIVLVLSLIAVALVACTPAPVQPPVASVPTVVIPTPTAEVAGVTYQVQRGEVMDILQMTGRVAAAVDADVFFTDDGFIETLHVQRGDKVTSGQLLAELNLGELPDQIEQARADLGALQRLIQTSRAQRQVSVENAQILLQAARDSLERLKQPPNPLKVQAAQDKLERTRISLENIRNNTSAEKVRAAADVQSAADNLRNEQAAYSSVVWQNGSRPLDELDAEERQNQEQALRAVEAAERELNLANVAYELAVQNEINAVALAESDIEEAQRSVEELQVPPDPFDLRDAERTVRSAQLNLNSALSSRDDPTMSTRIEQSQRGIDELTQKIEKSKLYAPFESVVAEVGAKPGDRVTAFQPVINLIEPDSLQLAVIDIASFDLLRITAGQAVDISFARYPGQTLPGTVQQLPSDQVSPGSQVRADPLLRIAFEQGKFQLDLGDIADVTLTFSRKPNALWLPPQALQQFGDRTFVIIKDGEQQRAIDITIGISTAERVEILTGVQEGDTVVATNSGL